jgi:DNA repair exonuclease SbcCD ATPase subunit
MSGFADLRLNQIGSQTDESFWPSFTDIMMVVVMIFLITSATLILRNTELIRQITESEQAEKLAAGIAEDSLAENATLGERLKAAQRQLSMARLQQLMTMEEKFGLEKNIRVMQEQISELELARSELDALLAAARASGETLSNSVERLQQQLSQSEQQRHAMADKLESSISELDSTLQQLESSVEELNATNQTLNELQDHYNLTRVELTQMIDRLAQSGVKIDQLQRDKLTDLGSVQLSEEKLSELGAEYAILKSKYDKLVLPARTSRGKYVVSLRYTRVGSNRIIELKKPEDAEFSQISEGAVHTRLGALKAQYAENLYIKIIIPANSNLSYNEAWSFTRKMLDLYDYYHQGDYQPIVPLE